jgi:hypothetical protein
MENENNMPMEGAETPMANEPMMDQPKADMPMGDNKPKKSKGALVGIIVVIIILVVAGIMMSRDKGDDYMTPEEAAITDEAMEEQGAMSDSTMVADLEADLDSTSFDGLDADLDALDAETQ